MAQGHARVNALLLQLPSDRGRQPVATQRERAMEKTPAAGPRSLSDLAARSDQRERAIEETPAAGPPAAGPPAGLEPEAAYAGTFAQTGDPRCHVLQACIQLDAELRQEEHARNKGNVGE